MIYPIKTLSQLPLVLKGFRKEKGLTQAAMAERLGITQQSYAYFETNPATATLERLHMVLRLLDVEISLDQSASAVSTSITSSVKTASKRPPATKTTGQKTAMAPSALAARKTKPSVVAKAEPRAVPSRKKESW